MEQPDLDKVSWIVSLSHLHEVSWRSKMWQTGNIFNVFIIF